MTCERVVKGEMAEKYLLGQLTEAEQEAFEQHYFGCPRCSEELETYRALQAELKRSAPAIRAEAAVPQAGWRWAWAGAAAGVLLAVGVGFWLRHQVPGVQPAPRVVVTPPARVPAPPQGPTLAELAQVQPPPYAPATLRGTTDEATRRFRNAMQHYAKGDYGAAIPGLRAAAQLSPRAPNVSFFLGICYLLTDRTEASIAQLHNTAAIGDSTYLENAHFFLAKAYLRQANLAAAQTELKKTVQLHGQRESEARKLLEQLERLSQRPR